MHVARSRPLFARQLFPSKMQREPQHFGGRILHNGRQAWPIDKGSHMYTESKRERQDLGGGRPRSYRRSPAAPPAAPSSPIEQLSGALRQGPLPRPRSVSLRRLKGSGRTEDSRALGSTKAAFAGPSNRGSVVAASLPPCYLPAVQCHHRKAPRCLRTRQPGTERSHAPDHVRASAADSTAPRAVATPWASCDTRRPCLTLFSFLTGNASVGL